MKTAEKWIEENICMPSDEIREFRGNRIAELMESYAKERAQGAYPDTETDGYVFCGKCGKMK